MFAKPILLALHTLAGLALAALFMASVQPNLRAFAADPNTLAGRALAVDGDTIVIDRIRIRLKGIAAPEISEPGGPEGRDALNRLIGDKPVHCSLTGEKNHGRPIGFCSIQAVDLNAAMVRSGFALSCPRFSGRYVGLEPANGLVQRVRYKLPDYCVVKDRQPPLRR